MSATVRQLQTIDRLVTQLGLEGTVKDQVYAIARQPDARPSVEVSRLISGMIEKARAREAAQPATDRPAAGRGQFELVPDGRYALSLETLLVRDLQHLIGGEGDMVFVRVSTWTPPGKGPVTFLRQIKGSPGDWAKIKLSREDTAGVRDALLDVTPQAAGKLFSQAYTCCARCLSPLTDQRSRETGYGPDCRAHVGLA